MIDTAAPADRPPMMWGLRQYKYAGKYLNSGNRCGHDPQKLAVVKLSLPETHSGHRLKIIDDLIERAHAYFDDPASVPLLAYLSGKTNRDGSPRQNRSEAREAQSLIMSAIFAALDFKSLRVGTYTQRGEFKNLSFDELARRCGLTRELKNLQDPQKVELVACSRFWRGIAWLKRAGVIEVFEQYEETAEGMRGRPAIKTVSAKFLRLLGRMTKRAFESIRKKSSRAVAKYLGGAALVGIQSADESEQLARDIRSEQARKEYSKAPVRKNQFPKSVEPDSSTDNLKSNYQAYSVAFMAAIEAKLGRKIRGAGESQRLFKEHGGLLEPDWRRRRTEL